MIYFWRSYTATKTASIRRTEECESCSHIFSFDVKCVAVGSGHSGYFTNNSGAASTANERARIEMNRQINEAIEHCPECGNYQQNMVLFLRKIRGKNYDPNKYAAERVSTPLWRSWYAASAINSKDSFSSFIEMWPVGHANTMAGKTALILNRKAKRALLELKYPSTFRVINFLGSMFGRSKKPLNLGENLSKMFVVIWWMIVLSFAVIFLSVMINRLSP